MIVAENLHYRMGSRVLLTGVNLKMEPGRVIAVLGANGAGKSTLLRLLAGETPPDAGTVRYDGCPLSPASAVHWARQRAVMPQSFPCPFDFTVREVVALGRLPHVTSETDSEEVAWALAEAGVENLKNRTMQRLSGGERQRVDFARVLCQLGRNPTPGRTALLLDEPAASLDLQYQERLLLSLRAVRERGVAVLVISHDLNWTLRMADEVLLLKGGHCVAQGPVREVMQESLLTETFSVPFTRCLHPHRDDYVLLAG